MKLLSGTYLHDQIFGKKGGPEMRKVKGISILTAMLLLFQLFGFNAGLIADSENEASGEVSVTYVNHSEDSIQWKVYVKMTSPADEEVVSELIMSEGLSHLAIDAPEEVTVEKTAEGYRLMSKSGSYEVDVHTTIADPLVEQFSLVALTTFSEQTIHDADFFELKLVEEEVGLVDPEEEEEVESEEQVGLTSVTISSVEDEDSDGESESLEEKVEDSETSDEDESTEGDVTEDESGDDSSAENETEDEADESSEIDKAVDTEEEKDEAGDETTDSTEEPGDSDQPSDASDKHEDDGSQEEESEDLVNEKEPSDLSQDKLKNELSDEQLEKLKEQAESTISHPAFKSTNSPQALNGQSSGNNWPDPGSLKLDKSASETGTYAEWEVDLKIEGMNLQNSSDIVLVLDKSGSMANNNRLTKAKAAAIQFVDQLLVRDSATRIALVEFGEHGTMTRDFTNHSRKQQLKNQINGISASGGTNIQAGLHQADLLLEDSTADQKTIVLLSDGAPTFSFKARSASSHSWPDNKYNFILSNFNYNNQLGNGSTYNYPDGCSLLPDWLCPSPNDTYRINSFSVETNGIPTISEAQYILNSGIDIYSIGLEVGNDSNANYVLENSQNRGYYAGGSDDLSPIFDEIAASLLYPATDAVVLDPLGDMFNLVEDGSYSGQNFDVSHGSVTWNEASETFQWNIGNIQEDEDYTLTYKVKLDWSKNPKGLVEYPTNGVTPLNYKDPDGEQSQKHFSVPEVSIDTGKIDKYGYRVNIDGEPVDSNGNVVSKFEAEILYHELVDEDLPFNIPHEVEPNSVDDYTLLVGDDPTEVTLTGEKPFQSVWFGYVKSDEMVAGDVTVRHVDEDGNELANTETLSGLIGESYTSNEKQISGYTFIGLADDSAPKSGKFTKDAQTVIYVYSKQLGSLTIIKVDELGEPLDGAEFELTGKDGFSMTKTSDEDGIITFEELDWGTYTLKETKAPGGYRLLTSERTIKISDDSLHVQEEIENTLQDWEIPQTGGIGTIGFYGIGLVLMAIATYFYVRRRKAVN